MKILRIMYILVMVFNRLFVIGGKIRGFQDIKSFLDVEFYNLLFREWILVSFLFRGIYYLEVSVCQNIIYVFGFEVEIVDVFNLLFDCFFKYNVIIDQWFELVVEFGQFFYVILIKVVLVNCIFYICDFFIYKVYSFCFDICVWKGEGFFECVGFNVGVIGIEDKIYILGGDYVLDEIIDEVQVYYSSRLEWEEVLLMLRVLIEFYCQVIQFNKYRDLWYLNYF